MFISPKLLHKTICSVFIMQCSVPDSNALNHASDALFQAQRTSQLHHIPNLHIRSRSIIRIPLCHAHPGRFHSNSNRSSDIGVRIIPDEEYLGRFNIVDAFKGEL